MSVSRFALGAALLSIVACGAREPAELIAARKAAETAAAQSSLREAYFGDLHIHTRNSFDASSYGVRATPDDAYRYARGETLTIPTGPNASYDVKLDGPPLDFLAVTDHGEYMGVVRQVIDPATKLGKTPFAKSAAKDANATFLTLAISNVTGEEIAEIYDREVIDTAWKESIDAAERHYKPGEFTTFAGYEFTAMRPVPLGEGALRAAANLHRNVIFRGSAPPRLFSTLDSTNPEDLWDWMDAQRAAGHEVLSIPHNSNGSNGWMFALTDTSGAPLTAAYAEQRARNEPLTEISQIKGTSETHPSLSPNDEWSSFEQYEIYIGSPVKSTPGAGDFTRDALGRGLVMEAAQGFNPYKFGYIAASDTHIAAGMFTERNYWGKFPQDGASPEMRQSVPPAGVTRWEDVKRDPAASRRTLAAPYFSAAGIAGVWADANTREAIFDAMKRKETFGTSGPRIKVRSFASFGFDETLLTDANAVKRAYTDGVPMGSELSAKVADARAAPAIFAWAMKDPDGAGLERLQIVKVWEEGGAAKEAVIDAACAGGAAPVNGRCAKATAVLDLASCAITPGNEAAELKTVWRDPDYAPGQRAAYYVRVLEIETCRWSTWDAVRKGTPPNPVLPKTVQERAWTSPVWVKPG
jgi:hypothetical protein